MGFHTTLILVASALAVSRCEAFDSVAALATHGIDVAHSGLLRNEPHLPTTYHNASFYSCDWACTTLRNVVPGSVVYPNSSDYNLAEAGYWSEQQALTEPHCFYYPTTARDVAVAVLVSRLTQCPFAAKSGGHAAFANASNIEGGITIHLVKLNEITLSADRSVASIGPGNTWYDVYSNLEQYNLTVIGGRVAAIGVGGLTLGGGISFFSGKYGWACDNVYNYELVTADGSIINVNPNSSSDLYWALRGGGNNFGLVTRFDMYTYPQGLMWGGSRYMYGNQSNAVLNALVGFSNDAPADPNAAMWVAYAMQAEQLLIVVETEYALPTPNPPIFNAFAEIPHLVDLTMVNSLSNITILVNASNPGGFRETYWAATTKVDIDLLQYMVKQYRFYAQPLANITGLLPAMIFQIITTDQLSHMPKRGGNALGLTEDKGPLILFSLSWSWVEPSDDHVVIGTCQSFLDDVVAYAKSKGLDNQYIYMNYASQFQDVVPSYNATNHARLLAVARKYDPQGVFQKLQPGYFKLNGAPGGTVVP